MTLLPVHELSQTEIERFFQLLAIDHKNYFALRVLGGTAKGRTLYPHDGYFTSITEVTNAAYNMSKHGYDAVYCTLQPIKDECAARSLNQWTPSKKDSGLSVGNSDIKCYRLLLLDFDPVRLSGISSTHEELSAAIALANAVQEYLAGLDWPDPLYKMMSGNGVHLAYRVRGENVPDFTALLRDVLIVLDAQFSTEQVKIDKKMFNASRITKIAGVMARKGSDLAERPHRASYLIESNAHTGVVKTSKLKALAKLVHAHRDGQGEVRAPRNLQEFVDACEEHGLNPAVKEGWGKNEKNPDGYPLVSLACWREQHPNNRNRPAFVIFRGDNKITAKCQHESCDASTINLIATLGWSDEVPKVSPDEQRKMVEALNRTGLCIVMEGDTVLYIRAGVDENGKPRPLARWKNQQTVRAVYDTYGRLTGDDGHEQHPFNVWSKSADRREAPRGTCYAPGTPYGAVVEGRLNLWAGGPYTPKSSRTGDRLVRAYRRHLEAHMCGGSEELSEYLWKLFAWKVQNPIALPCVFLVLTGDQGSGKNTLALPLVNLFGQHGLHTQATSVSRFNSKLEGRALVYHDEAEFLRDPRVMRNFKALVTEQQLTYESKGVDTYQGKNIGLHIAASNDVNVHVEQTDRRILLLRTQAPEEKAEWFRAQGLDRLIGQEDLEREESIAFHRSLLAALLEEPGLSNEGNVRSFWRPFPAPHTGARAAQIADHLPPLETWVATHLARGVVPGLTQGTTIGGMNGAVVGAPVPWTEGFVITPGDRLAMWESFRAWLEGQRLNGRAVTGSGSPHAFQTSVNPLLGVASKVRKSAGVPERVWLTQKLTVTRVVFAERLGVSDAETFFNAFTELE